MVGDRGDDGCSEQEEQPQPRPHDGVLPGSFDVAGNNARKVSQQEKNGKVFTQKILTSEFG